MKINYLGTGAAERIPGIFCNCKLCKYAREKKGREIRTQTQLIIDDVLLIDFPGDSYLHLLQYDLCFADFDSLAFRSFLRRGFGLSNVWLCIRYSQSFNCLRK